MQPSENKIVYQDCGCYPAIVVHLMSMLIFINNDGTSGQSACDCSGRGTQGDLLERAAEIKVKRGLADGDL